MENTRMMGYAKLCAGANPLAVAHGRFITQADEEHRSEVVFVGPELVRNFSPTSTRLERNSVQTHTYEVIGVAEPLGSAFGRVPGNYMVMPFPLGGKAGIRTMIGVAIFVQAPNAEMMQPVRTKRGFYSAPGGHLPTTPPTISAIFWLRLDHQLWHDLTGNLAFRGMALVSVFWSSAERDYEHHAGQCVGADARDRVAALVGARKKHSCCSF